MITVEIDEVFVVDENTSDIITIDGGIVEISQGTENKTVVIDESFEQVVDVVTENTVDIFLASKSANDNAVITAIAGESINATSAIYQASDNKVFRADSGNLAHASLVLGVALQSVTIGTSVEILLSGKIDDGAYSAFGNQTALYLNGLGILSATPPTSGFSLAIGKKAGNTIFYADLKTAIILV